MSDRDQLETVRTKIHAYGYKPTARESGVPETTVRRFAYGADILHGSTMKLLAWAFPVGQPKMVLDLSRIRKDLPPTHVIVAIIQQIKAQLPDVEVRV